MKQIVAALVLALFSVMAGYGYGHQHGAAGVQAKWDTEKEATVTAQRIKAAELQSNMDTLRKAYSNETSKLSRTVAALNDRVRSRPTRPAVPASAASGDGAAGCTGAQLYASDAEFLIRESARADQLRLALITCQNAYRKASGQ